MLEAAVALAFGIWLNTLHARIDHFVDSVLFRRRHLAEAHLQRVAATLPHAEDAEFIDDALVVDACDTLAIASAAVFRRDGAQGFARTLSRGWSDAHAKAIARSDRLSVRLLAELEPADLADVRWERTDVPAGIGQPLLDGTCSNTSRLQPQPLTTTSNPKRCALRRTDCARKTRCTFANSRCCAR